MDIRENGLESLRENIALVLQDTHLFTGTVMENIRYGRLDAADEEVIAAAKTANADAFIRRLQNGYDTVLEAGRREFKPGTETAFKYCKSRTFQSTGTGDG